MKTLGEGWHPASAFIEVEGDQHHVVCVGQQTRERSTVVFIHGLLCSSWAWRHNITPIATHHRVIVPCLKGFGWSDRPRSSYTIPDLAGSLLRLLDRLDIEHFTPVGNSLGGTIALYLAHRYPERIEGMVLVNPLAQESALPEVPHALLDERLEVLYRLAFWPTISRVGLQLLAYRGVMLDAEHLSGFTLPLKRRGSAAHALQIGRNLRRDVRQIEPSLHQIEQPTLILWGRSDRLLGSEGGRRLHRVMPNARLLELDRCGHCAHEEYPSRFNSALLSFLKPE